jgi:trans-aconitate methyltransferase
MVRDTDADWNVIATHQPYFGVLANERYLAENLTPDAIEAFYESGQADIDHVMRVLARVTGGEVAPRRGLDFGCGTGRLTFAMAKYAGEVVGVDVAEGMLRIARERALAQKVGNIELRTTLPTEPVDWINSLIVFQHIPPPRGYAMLAELVELLAPGGLVSVQLTFFRDDRHIAEITRDLADYRYDGTTVELLSHAGSPAGGMSMYDYDLNRVLRTLFLGGIESVTTEHTDHGGSHGAWFYGRKNA